MRDAHHSATLKLTEADEAIAAIASLRKQLQKLRGEFYAERVSQRDLIDDLPDVPTTEEERAAVRASLRAGLRNGTLHAPVNLKE